MSKTIFVLIQKIITTLALAERRIRGDLIGPESILRYVVKLNLNFQKYVPNLR